MVLVKNISVLSLSGIILRRSEFYGGQFEEVEETGPLREVHTNSWSATGSCDVGGVLLPSCNSEASIFFV